MVGTYWGTTSELVRYSDRFELTLTHSSPRPYSEYYTLYETNPESLLREVDCYLCDYEEDDEDDYNNPCYEKFQSMSWDGAEILRRMLEDDRETGWNQLLPGYSKYECEV